MRSTILSIVESITPGDRLEAEHRARAIEWIGSGAGLFRTAKPGTPDPHVVSYVVVLDPDAGKILLVDHRNACLWLPSGGHVEPGEHPRVTAEREVREELSLAADFLFDEPVFITVTETVGLTAGHTDVSLWYALRGDSSRPTSYDEEEFAGVRWFTPEEILYDRADPHLGRFVGKVRRNAARVSGAPFFELSLPAPPQ